MERTGVADVAAADLVERYFDVVDEQGRCSSRRNWERYIAYLFDDVSFAGKAVLDIGAGNGLMGVYAACAGAEGVICLEPEAEGSRSGMTSGFEQLRGALAIGARVEMLNETFQAFDPAGRRFDVVILHNSVNHLDEPACTRLLEDEGAVATYLGLFRRIADLCTPGARLIITDCSRYNLFGLLGRRSPFARSITWTLHQSPEFWAGLLGRSGFERPRIRWTTFNRLGPVQRLILGNRVAAYLTTSRFYLSMVRAG